MFLKLYHISLIDLGNNITLIPKIPSNTMMIENSHTPRICVCTSITGCINGLNYPDNRNFMNKPLYLYQCIVDTEKVRIMQPTRADVEDAWITGELWLLDSTEFKFVRSYKVFKHAHIKDTAYSRFIFTSDEDDLPLDFRDGDIVYGEETNFSMLMIDFDHYYENRNSHTGIQFSDELNWDINMKDP